MMVSTKNQLGLIHLRLEPNDLKNQLVGHVSTVLQGKLSF
jgi:hypothetical protein